jgi:two-component system LytT family sensor kinase
VREGDTGTAPIEMADGNIETTTAQRRREREWPLYVFLTLLFGAYQGLNQLIGLRQVRRELAPWKPFVWELSSVLTIVALIPLITRFERRYRLDARPRRRAIAVHTVAAVVFSGVHTTCMVLLRKLSYLMAGESYDYGNVFVGAFYELQKDVITYAVILVVIFAFREFRIRRDGELRAAQLAAELGKARLQHLTAQIEPHFLFNSLNAISNRMHEDVHAADRMISNLADLLRAAYEFDGEVLVPLNSELDWLRGYAAMMGERFRGQLSFDLNVEPGLEGVKVPRLLLQPIVENAIKHGLGDGHGWLGVDVRREGGNLRYTISDDGAGFPDTSIKSGTGLSNISRRLELIFQSDHELTFAAREPHGTIVVMKFPVGE